MKNYAILWYVMFRYFVLCCVVRKFSFSDFIRVIGLFARREVSITRIFRRNYTNLRANRHDSKEVCLWEQSKKSLN